MGLNVCLNQGRTEGGASEALAWGAEFKGTPTHRPPKRKISSVHDILIQYV